MPNISHIGATIRDKTASPDILVISGNFLPQESEIAEYIYNRCLQDPERVIVLAASCSGDKVFDKAQQFPVYRWSILRDWRGFVGIIIKQILNMVCSFLLAIKLYFRYRYRYIEWGHGYGFPSLLLLSYLLPVRFFIYLDGNDILSILQNPVWRSLFALTLKRAKGIVCKSSFARDYLTTHFRFDAPTHVINPAVRPGKFGVAATPENLDDLRVRVREGYHIPETAVVILSVGSLVKHKGFSRVIDNIPLLLTIGLDVHYIICGEGPCEAKLKSLTRRLRVEGRVHFAGDVPDRELASYYAACDLFAMLTLFDAKAVSIEGLNIVYLEAGYFSKPVIASDLGGVIDAIRHEENGLLVNPNSGYEVFQAFCRLCQDSQLREQFGRQGKELAKRKTLHKMLYKTELGVRS
ncbi:MAG: glycosyltransferase family 4 protein [Heteroscytonema crispum UTEX LB 1556]